MPLLECSQGGMSESLGSSPGSIANQLCDLTSPMSLVLLTSNRKITPTLPTSQGCCEGLIGICESAFKIVKMLYNSKELLTYLFQDY